MAVEYPVTFVENDFDREHMTLVEMPEDLAPQFLTTINWGYFISYRTYVILAGTIDGVDHDINIRESYYPPGSDSIWRQLTFQIYNPNGLGFGYVNLGLIHQHSPDSPLVTVTFRNPVADEIARLVLDYWCNIENPVPFK